MQVLVDDGARIDVRVDGSNGDAIVLLHGFPFAKELWKAQIEELATSHRVVAPDLRGMGKSSVPPGPYLMQTLAGDVAAVMDHLGIARATIVGHSLGGYVALAFARMYAERVLRLALVASRIASDTEERAKQRVAQADRLESDCNAMHETIASISSMVSEKSRRDRIEMLENMRKIASANDPRGLAAMQRGMALRDSSEDIAPELAMPVLVLAGAADPLVPVQEARAIAEAFPRGTLALLGESGHLPMVEEPDALTERLLGFAE